MLGILHVICRSHVKQAVVGPVGVKNLPWQVSSTTMQRRTISSYVRHDGKKCLSRIFHITPSERSCTIMAKLILTHIYAPKIEDI